MTDPILSKAAKLRVGATFEIRSKRMALLAKYKASKLTAAQRKAHSLKMVAARKAKRAKKS